MSHGEQVFIARALRVGLTHLEDREIAAGSFWEGVRSGQGFTFETRSLRAQDATYRWHFQQTVVLGDPRGEVLRFVGTTTDIDDQTRTEDARREVQDDLARVNRVTTLGDLTASLAHELSQPISGAIPNTNVCLRKLAHDKPDLDKAPAVVARIRRDAQRAAEIINEIRSRFEKGAPNQESLNVNEIVPETIARWATRRCDTTYRSGRNWPPNCLRSSGIACNCSRSR